MLIENQQTTNKPNEYPKGLMERFGTSIKLFIIGFLTLVLLIPLSMIGELIRDRQSTQSEAIKDITSKWGSEQTIVGPCIAIPYTETVMQDNKQTLVENNLLILPESLSVKGDTKVTKRKRGIYVASVYTANLNLSGHFYTKLLNKTGIELSKLKLNEAKIILGLSDLKGIKEIVKIETNGKTFDFESGLGIQNLAVGAIIDESNYRDIPASTGVNDSGIFSVGLNAKLDSVNLQNENLPFNISLKVNGSQGLYIIPTGKTTTAQYTSDWSTPSFSGSFLPEKSEIKNNGFSSNWKVIDLNRSFAQVIKSDNQKEINQMAASRFGVRFIQAVDQYQQNTRSVKYAILIILLTFVVVLFIELMQKKSVNPFQYLLVGLALVLFYTLLLSMSEVVGFNLAYLIATVMTSGLITIHLSSILKNRKQGMLIGALIIFLYLFIYLLIQMESFSLLVGSVALFCFLAVIMYYSRKLKI